MAGELHENGFNILYSDWFSWPTWHRWGSLDRRGIDWVCDLEMVYVPPFPSNTLTYTLRFLHQPPHWRRVCHTSVRDTHTRPSRQKQGREKHSSRNSVKTRYWRILLIRAMCNHVPNGAWVGWNKICLEQCNCHWAPLRGCRHVGYLCDLGISTWRWRHDSISHVAEKRSVVVLHGHRFVLWWSAHIHVLLADIFSSCERSGSFPEWCFHLTWHTESDVDGCCIWRFRWVSQVRTEDITYPRTVGKLGYYLPWIASSGAIVAVAAGLISTFTPHTPTARWVGYQFLAGMGRGCGMAMVSSPASRYWYKNSDSDPGSPSSPSRTSFHQHRSPSGCLSLPSARHSAEHFSLPLHKQFSVAVSLMAWRDLPQQLMHKPWSLQVLRQSDKLWSRMRLKACWKRIIWVSVVTSIWLLGLQSARLCSVGEWDGIASRRRRWSPLRHKRLVRWTHTMYINFGLTIEAQEPVGFTLGIIDWCFEWATSMSTLHAGDMWEVIRNCLVARRYLVRIQPHVLDRYRLRDWEVPASSRWECQWELLQGILRLHDSN